MRKSCYTLLRYGPAITRYESTHTHARWPVKVAAHGPSAGIYHALPRTNSPRPKPTRPTRYLPLTACSGCPEHARACPAHALQGLVRSHAANGHEGRWQSPLAACTPPAHELRSPPKAPDHPAPHAPCTHDTTPCIHTAPHGAATAGRQSPKTARAHPDARPSCYDGCGSPSHVHRERPCPSR